MASDPVFPQAAVGKGMYESFYLRAVAPDRPIGAWIRYTVHKRPGQTPKGSLWCTVFDAERGAPFMHKYTTDELSAPADGWIAIGSDPAAIATGGSGASGDGGRLSPSAAEGVCGPASWSLRISGEDSELRHLKQPWLYRAPLPRTKLTSPAPAASFDGTIELPDRTLDLRGWRGMVGHNWGAEHAERWIWLHGIDFAEDRAAWLDVALGRVLVAGRMTPWLASGAISLHGRRLRLGGLAARGTRVAESPTRCSLSIPGEDGLLVQAYIDDPPGAAAGWRYADPGAHGPQGRVGEHDVVNCSVAALSLNVRPRGLAATTLHTAHGAAYELGMRERDHDVPLAPFGDG
ncbi:MAG: hypothetical protein ACRDK4_05635 [Solirubrobacteraceae bacterium]